MKAINSDSEKTITNFGTQYHFLNLIKSDIVINGYITPNTSNVKEIDLGIHPTKDTKLELYIQNKSGNLGNGSTNLGLETTIDGAGGTYPDSNDWRFFWTS